MPQITMPFNKPNLTGKEIEYIKEQYNLEEYLVMEYLPKVA